ncbi:MAG: ferritin-like domain-containing protein, partial [Rubrobacteraceae bacterium]
ALTLEFLEAEFYQIAVGSGVLSEPALTYITAIGDHENQHVEALIGLITEAGGTPVEKPEFTFPADAFSSESSIVGLAGTFEPVGVGAYLGAGVLIQSPDVLAAAGSIAAVEGQHVVAVNNLLGVVPPANEAFPAALTQDEVLAAVAPFLGMGVMMDTGGQPLKG